MLWALGYLISIYLKSLITVKEQLMLFGITADFVYAKTLKVKLG